MSNWTGEVAPRGVCVRNSVGAAGAFALLLAACSGDGAPALGIDPSQVGVDGSLAGVGATVDTDMDGIPDIVEGTGDADGDGIPAHLDPDEFGGADAGGGTGGPAGPPGNTGGSGSGTTGTPPLTVDNSFIWVANTDQGTVSKLDTRTMEELGRYMTSPAGAGKPSRTSVGPDGSVAVANRGGTTQGARVEAGVTKIYASEQFCEDRNGNGSIETSHGKSEVLPWMEDECIAWHVPLDYYSNRPVAWAPLNADDPSGKTTLWTAGATNCPSSACNFDVLQLDGETGATLDTISIGPLCGIDFITGTAGGLDPCGFLPIPIPSIVENYGPYGGASDGGGNFWLFTANTTHLVRISAADHSVKTWPIPGANGYGITVGSKGRVFLCGQVGVSRFDPQTETWDASSGGVTLGYNGCMTDGKGTLWVGGGVDSGDPGLHAFDTDTLMWKETHAVGAVKGVSIDIDGMVWGIGAWGASMTSLTLNTAFRVDPATGDVQTYDGLDNAYSYSDMTGFGLAQAGVVEIF